MKNFHYIISVLLLDYNANAQAGLERPCILDADCVAPNSVCTLGVCECNKGFVQSNYPARCLPVPKSRSDPCEDDLQCSEAFLLGSYCGESERCECFPDYHFNGEICLKQGTFGLNDRCNEDTECSIDGSYCKDKSYCACEEDRVASKDFKRCLTLAKNIGDRCEEDLQCTETLLLGSQCKSGACACRVDHHYGQIQNKNGCYKDKKIGDVCTEVNECTTKPDSERVACNSVCECKSPFIASEDKTLCNGGSMLGGILVLIVSSLLAKFIQ